MKRIAFSRSASFTVFILSIWLFLAGILFKEANVILLASVIVLIQTVLFALSELNKGIALLMYVVSFATFMLSNLLINLLWNPASNDSYYPSLCLIYVAVSGIYLGAFFYKNRRYRLNCSGRTDGDSKPSIKMLWLQKLSGILFYMTVICAWAVNIEKIAIVRRYGYIGLYTNYISSLPLLVHKLAVINTTSLFMYLVTFPKKWRLYIATGFFCVGIGLELLTGVRGGVVTSLMLLLTYVVIYNSRRTSEQIFSGKYTKPFLTCAAVIFIAFMGMYSSIRLGEDSGNLLSGFGGFFSQQGGSVNVLKWSIQHKAELKMENTNYSLSIITHYNRITEQIGRFLFGSLGDGTDLHSGNLGKNITYLIEPIYYGTGGSFGTAYLAELFIDFSYIGIVLYNIFLGWLLMKMGDMMGDMGYRHWIINVYFLYMIRALYFLPRDSAFSFISPLLSTTNLLIIIVMVLAVNLLARKSLWRS